MYEITEGWGKNAEENERNLLLTEDEGIDVVLFF